ncbi:unnamed protein product [Urochloa humidicola]
MLQMVWVRAEGIPEVVRKEPHVMELAYLVGDPEEVHLESLKWKSVWVKVACRDPKAIGGTSEVFINKQGWKISWYVEEKAPGKVEGTTATRGRDDGGDTTDEDDPESQESYGVKETDWFNPGVPPNQNTGTDTASDQQQGGRSHSKRALGLDQGDEYREVDVGEEIATHNALERGIGEKAQHWEKRGESIQDLKASQSCLGKKGGPQDQQQIHKEVQN